MVCVFFRQCNYKCTMCFRYYDCWLDSFGNSSTASWSSDPEGTIGPSYYFRARCTSFHIFTLLFLPSSSVSVLFHSCCSHTEVFRKDLCVSSTFPIPIGMVLDFFAKRDDPCLGQRFACRKLTIILLIIIIIRIIIKIIIIIHSHAETNFLFLRGNNREKF